MQTVTVHVTPVTGYDHRARAGRVWAKGTHVVKVVESPSAPDEITPAMLSAIRADAPHFVIDGAPSEDVAALHAKIAALTLEVSQLTAHLEAATKPRSK